MASNVQELATIIAGDPMHQVERGAKKASTQLAQFKHQKEIIDMINKTVSDAEKKAGKGMFGWNVAGNLLGQLGIAALGVTNPWLAALVAGSSGGLLEKMRQDYHDPTGKLKQLEGRLKGRGQLEDVNDVRENIEGTLDEMAFETAVNAATQELMTPDIIKGAEGTKEIMDPEIIKGLEEAGFDISSLEDLEGLSLEKGFEFGLDPDKVNIDKLSEIFGQDIDFKKILII